MYRNSDYATYSNKKARNMGLATFKSWEDMNPTERRSYKRAEKLSYSELRALQQKAEKAYKFASDSNVMTSSNESSTEQ